MLNENHTVPIHAFPFLHSVLLRTDVDKALDQQLATYTTQQSGGISNEMALDLIRKMRPELRE